MTCRLCGSTDLVSVVDLGATPPCELFLTAEQVDEPERTYPLHLRVCTSCWLAQLPPLITPEETFTEYAYFSSYSTSWVEHARTFVGFKPDGTVDQAFPPTGRSFASTQTHWLRVRDGQVIEHWANRDDMGTAFQLGWIPPSPAYLVRMARATRQARRHNGE